MGWTPEQVTKMTGNELRAALTEAATAWHDGPKLGELVDRELAKHPNPADLAAWASQRFGQKVGPEELADPAKRKDVLVGKGKTMLRTEVTQLERYILLQIIDMAWKDHLYAMDQLKDSVHLRGYAERDPRIEYKREGSNLFVEMQGGVRDRVTELIFKARLTANVQMRNVYGSQQAHHVDAAAVAARGTAQQPRRTWRQPSRRAGKKASTCRARPGGRRRPRGKPPRIVPSNRAIMTGDSSSRSDDANGERGQICAPLSGRGGLGIQPGEGVANRATPELTLVSLLWRKSHVLSYFHAPSPGVSTRHPLSRKERGNLLYFQTHHRIREITHEIASCRSSAGNNAWLGPGLVCRRFGISI